MCLCARERDDWSMSWSLLSRYWGFTTCAVIPSSLFKYIVIYLYTIYYIAILSYISIYYIVILSYIKLYKQYSHDDRIKLGDGGCGGLHISLNVIV